MKVALFGGSFDPPHQGHRRVIEVALDKLDIDKLYVIPTYLNPFKKEFFYDEVKRFQLVKDLVKGLKKVEVLDIEIKKKRAVATYETVKDIYNMYNVDKVYLIIGADNLENLKLWYNYDKLKDMVEFVVATRNNIKIPKKYETLKVNEDISSTKIRSKIAES